MTTQVALFLGSNKCRSERVVVVSEPRPLICTPVLTATRKVVRVRQIWRVSGFKIFQK